MLADFAAIVMKVIVGVWSWQTYQTVRAVLLSPLSRCSLSFGGFFLFYIITDNTHTHIEPAVVVDCMCRFIFLAQKNLRHHH